MFIQERAVWITQHKVILTCFHNLQTNTSSAASVVSLLQANSMSLHTCIKIILYKNLLNVMFVISHFLPILHLPNNQVFTTMKNPLNVLFAVNHFLRNLISLDIYVFTTMSKLLNMLFEIRVIFCQIQSLYTFAIMKNFLTLFYAIRYFVRNSVSSICILRIMKNLSNMIDAVYMGWIKCHDNNALIF